METLLAICAGIALAAACGFRVFVPLLVASVAVHFGHLQPSANLAWVGSVSAMLIFGVATLVEVAGYYIPWVDHLLDTIASPCAVVAGTLVAATAFGDVNPAFKWAIALIAGGGAAAAIQGTTVATRALSTGTTGGLANPIVSTLELIGAVLLAVAAILVPILAVALVACVLFLLVRLICRLRSRKQPAPATT